MCATFPLAQPSYRQTRQKGGHPLDKEAFTRIYAAQARYVWNLCLTLLHNPADTEDAVQETFLRLLRQGDAGAG